MVDSGGPGASDNIKVCTTLGISDLGDTIGFDDPGKENQLYAFQLEDGTYKRKEISANGDGGGGGPQTFGELSDVNLEAAVSNKPYQFVLTDNSEWIPYLDPVTTNGGWDLDLKIEQPYIHIGKNHEFRKIQNSGKLLAAYHSKKDLIVKNTDFGYVIAKRGSRGGTLRLNKQFDFGQPTPASTFIIDIVLGDVPDDFVDVIKGLKIRWSQEDANSALRIFIRMPLNDQEIPLLIGSLQNISNEVKKDLLSYDFIHIGPIQFQRLRYTTLDLGIPYLKTI